MTPPGDRTRHPDVLEINGLRATLVRAGRLLLEAVVVPTVLLAILLHVIGTTRSILVAVGWCALAISFRWYVDRRLPGTLLLGSAAQLLAKPRNDDSDTAIEAMTFLAKRLRHRVMGRCRSI